MHGHAKPRPWHPEPELLTLAKKWGNRPSGQSRIVAKEAASFELEARQVAGSDGRDLGLKVQAILDRAADARDQGLDFDAAVRFDGDLHVLHGPQRFDLDAVLGDLGKLPQDGLDARGKDVVP